MARCLFVRLNQPEFDALVRLADADRRDPRDEGAVLVVEGLLTRGLLADSSLPQPSLVCTDEPVHDVPSR
jgi:hypothetical protein